MSQRTERLTERLSLDSASEYVEAWYHIPLLLVLAGFMFWIRARNWENFVIDGRVYFTANDPWYHLRQVRYTVRHWPWTMPFDPWTGFPTGSHVGQFGTLYDQLVATAALIIGLGSPSAKTTALVLLFAPAVLGTLVVIPTYLLGKRFGGRFGGVVGVAILALSPSTFLARSVVGFSDHHVAEVLFQSLAVVAIVVALAVAEHEKPIYEQFAERDFDNLRRPVGWAALAGFAITVYIWTWPPGLLLVGIFGVFILVALPLQYLRGRSPEHIAIVGAVALSVAGVLMLFTFKTFEISTTNFSILHPVLALVGAAGCVFLAWLARAVESRDLPAVAYPGVIVGLFVAGVLVVYIALPTVFDFFIGQLSRIVGFGTGKAALTVGEIQPPFPTGPGVTFKEAVDATLEFFYNSYGYAYITAAAGALIMLVRLALGRTEKWAAMLFVLIWTAFMTSATLTQARFNYYLIVPVAVLNAYFIGEILRLVGAWDVGMNVRNLEAYQVLAVAMAVLLVIAPLAFMGVAGPITFFLGGPLTAVSASANAQTAGPGPVLGWDDSLQWLQNNTPAVGQYNGSQGDRFEYYGTFQPKDDNFNYTAGSYGILSWWDYGHWITVLGHRPPVANPFQQHVPMVANFLLATNTTVANNIVQTGDGEGIQYVMISWEMADPSGILSAPFFWETKWDVKFSDAVSRIYFKQADGTLGYIYAHEQRYYESIRTRLYAFHGSEIELKPVVLDYRNPVYTANGSLQYAFYPRNTSLVKRFPNMSAAREFVKQDGSAQIGGIGRYPHERVPALKHYRLVHMAKKSAVSGPQGRGPLLQTVLKRYQVTGLNITELLPTVMSWVKTFERVPGAKVVGHGPPNATIEATVEMRVPTTNTTFNYTQQATTNAQGRFTMILPYSTTGYEKWGVERGATNVSVRATGPYTFYTVEGPDDGATWTATAEVPEGMVIGRVDGPIRVTLKKQPVSTGTNATNTSTNTSTTAGNATVANGTGGAATGSTNETGPNATSTNTTATNTTTNANRDSVVGAHRLAVTSRQEYTT